jgi:hypothetical protein
MIRGSQVGKHRYSWLMSEDTAIIKDRLYAVAISFASTILVKAVRAIDIARPVATSFVNSDRSNTTEKNQARRLRLITDCTAF